MSQTINHSKLNIYDFFFGDIYRKTYTNIGLSLLLIIVFLVFALRPTINTIGLIREKIKAYDEVNDKIEEKIANSRQLQLQLTQTKEENPDGLKSEIDFLNKAFIQDYSLKTVYKNLYERAQKNQSVIRSISPKYPEKDIISTEFDYTIDSPSGKLYELSIVLESKTMTDMESFLSTVEGAVNFPLFSRVKSVNITNNLEMAKIQQSESGLPASIATSINMIIYVDPSIQTQELLRPEQ